MPEAASLIDVLDRVIDKGICIDAYMRFTLAGVSVLSVDVSIVVASIETHLTTSMPLLTGPVDRLPADRA